MELRRAQDALHKTTAQLPVVGDDGEPAAEAVEIWFRPLTAGMLDRLEKASKKTDLSLIEGQVRLLAEQLVRWSITDGGQEVAPSAEVLRTLNRYQIEELIRAIRDYTIPKKTT